MTPPPTTTAWAIKAPDGQLILKTLSDFSELNSWCFLAGGQKKNHAAYKARGYSCVRVNIQEIQE